VLNTQALPANYWRSSQKWQQLLGKKGKVVASTIIRVSSAALANQVPYAYLVVDFGDHKAELMGTDDLHFQPGEEVECVLRKIAASNEDEVVAYGIKVAKVISD
jgi:uncharacterized OB-fold protein